MKTIIVSFGVLALLVLPAAGQEKEDLRVGNSVDDAFQETHSVLIRNPHSEIRISRISLVETVIHWPRTPVELQDGAVGT